MRSGVVVAVLLVGFGIAWLMGSFAGVEPGVVRPPQDEVEAVSDSNHVVEPSTKRDLVDEGPAAVTHEAPQSAPEDAAVIGRVIDTALRPVSGASVQLWMQGDDRRAATVVTEADGTFRMLAKAVGTCDLVAWHSGFGFVRREALAVAIGALDLGDLVLQPRPSVSGHLIYPDGQAIAGMRVRLGIESGAAAQPLAGVFHEEVQTDESGRFQVLDLAEGVYIARLQFFALRGEKKPVYRFATGQAAQTVTIAYHRIRVRGSNGLGMRGWSSARSDEVRTALQAGVGWRELFDHPDARGAGGFLDTLVAYDSWWRLCSSEGAKWREAFVHAESIRNETEVDLSLLPVEMSGRLRLRVQTVDGSVPKDAKLDRIYASALHSPGRYEAAGRDGDDFLFRVTPGSYQLRIRMGLGAKGLDAFAPVEREVHIKANQETLVTAEARSGGRVQITLHLPGNKKVGRVARLKVTNLGPSGEPVEVRPYIVHTVDGHTVGATPSETPIICARILRPGRHQLTVAAKDYQTERVTAFVETGKITPVEVWLQR